MSRYSGIVQSVEQRTVNPYVTGSSPVARATIYRRFLRFFFTFAAAICSGIKSQKSSKNTYFLYILYTKLYICYTDFFETAFLSLLNQRNINKFDAFRRFTKNQSNIFLVRMSRLYKFYIFTEKSTHYTLATHGLIRPYVGF